jgi:hypothetical protein
MRFTCTTCGKEHDFENISFGAEAPLQWSGLSKEERSRSRLSQDQCEIVWQLMCPYAVHI